MSKADKNLLATESHHCRRTGKRGTVGDEVVNAMTIDVEDYFQVSAFEPHVGRHTWNNVPSRIEKGMDTILEILNKNNVLGTFFILGWIAEKYPNIVSDLAHEGHEIASHGWWHQRVSSLTPEQFSTDIKRSKECLEAVSGVTVSGYRAPSYSINHLTPWAHDVLADAGYKYSSSIAPIKHDHYGIPDAPRFMHVRGKSNLIEVPVSTTVIANKNIACGGGGWFRLFPYSLNSHWIKKINKDEKQPVVFYTHPWEFDPQQPKMAGINNRTKFRHYFNLDKTESRFARLVKEHSWSRMDWIVDSMRELETSSPYFRHAAMMADG